MARIEESHESANQSPKQSRFEEQGGNKKKSRVFMLFPRRKAAQSPKCETEADLHLCNCRCLHE